MTEFMTQTILQHHVEFTRLVEDGALVVINHSGGKDSQALYAVMSRLVPSDQIVVVHADLGDEVEHLGVQAHIRTNIDHTLHVAAPIWKDGTPKTLLNAIERRGKWPSAAQRYCTSDLKRGPCEKVIRRLAKETGRSVVINCFGFRAEESSARAKRPTFTKVKRNCTADREWLDFSPIHDLSTGEVFDIIRLAGQEPHPVYETGNERLSCVFCVLGSTNDLRNGAKLRPELFSRYVELEDKMEHTFRAGQSLREIVGASL
jgi:3'-phosphoadenosine 5'-phosphosulfate sulfotransferase (PAPS reductase)/FAD synthetase